MLALRLAYLQLNPNLTDEQRRRLSDEMIEANRRLVADVEARLAAIDDPKARLAVLTAVAPLLY